MHTKCVNVEIEIVTYEQGDGSYFGVHIIKSPALEYFRSIIAIKSIIITNDAILNDYCQSDVTKFLVQIRGMASFQNKCDWC